MTANSIGDSMLELFIFETLQLIEQLEQVILQSEKSGKYCPEEINEIFRVMHTIKGSSAMMMFINISGAAHSVEDLFYLIREGKCKNINFSEVSDLVLSALDFFKGEIVKIESGRPSDGECPELLENIRKCIAKISKCEGIADPKADTSNKIRNKKGKHKYYISPASKRGVIEHQYEARVFFDDDCEMENIRAYTLMHNLIDKIIVVGYEPEDILVNENTIEIIRAQGFRLVFKANLEMDATRELFSHEPFINILDLRVYEETEEKVIKAGPNKKIVLEDSDEHKTSSNEPTIEADRVQKTTKQNFISVNLNKLDKLMDLVGELVISEAMVVRNPDLDGLELDNFSKAARQLNKLTGEMQDIVMSIRMVPLVATFQKMNRIVRDISKKLDKEVQLDIIGEETEVDKNIIENLSDPLMHLIRNSLDHGLESPEERAAIGKPKIGKITLEAKNSGGDVWIVIKDDGRGLNREKILAKAKENGLVKKPDNELTDKEIYSFILLPGFSTKETVTEFSGRGVGMDVVMKNIEKIGGSMLIDSKPGIGSTFSIKIPLTLAIIDGMVINVGCASYIVPTNSIRESFRPKEEDAIIDPDGNEMILIRGKCYPILRLHQIFNIATEVTRFEEGIIIMVEYGEKGLCLFADALIEEQQVVVKALPRYFKKVQGISGCTLLGDGSISLILDIAGLVEKRKEI